MRFFKGVCNAIGICVLLWLVIYLGSEMVTGYMSSSVNRLVP